MVSLGHAGTPPVHGKGTSVANTRSAKNSAKKDTKKSGATDAIVAKPPVKALATAADIAYAAARGAPAPLDKAPPRETSYDYTADVVETLLSPAVVGFFGEALGAEDLQADAAEASQTAAMRERVEHTLAVLALLNDAAAQRLYDRAAAVNKRWPEFEKAHPAEAAELATFREGWHVSHPGGGKKKVPKTPGDGK